MERKTRNRPFIYYKEARKKEKIKKTPDIKPKKQQKTKKSWIKKKNE